MVKPRMQLFWALPLVDHIKKDQV